MTGRAAFFTEERLGLALATVRFVAAFPRAALDGFLALGRALAPTFFWTFDDCFLRLAMIGPPSWYFKNTLMRDQKTTGPESRQPTLRVINSRSSAWARPLTAGVEAKPGTVLAEVMVPSLSVPRGEAER